MRPELLFVLVITITKPVSCWLTWKAGETTAEPNTAIATTTEHDASQDVVDMLRLLNVSSETPGISVLQGPLPAYKFRLTFDQVQLPNPDIIGRHLTNRKGFTIVFVYRQHRNSLGTLISVNSPGRVNPWFQLTSNLRTGQLVVHYRVTSDTKLHQATWFLKPSPKANHPKGSFGWTHLALSLDAEARIWSLKLNCNQAEVQPLAGTGQSYLDVPDDALVYFRQEPGFKKKFLGAMKLAKILPYSSGDVQNYWFCSSKREPSLNS